MNWFSAYPHILFRFVFDVILSKHILKPQFLSSSFNTSINFSGVIISSKAMTSFPITAASWHPITDLIVNNSNTFIYCLVDS